jgi:hypothetical protein
MDHMLDWLERNYLRASIGILALVVMVLTLAVAAVANAADATLTWTMPTQNTDGSAIPASGPGSLTSTRVEFGTCSGALFGTKAGEQSVAAPATTMTISGFSAAQTACFRAFVSNTYGVESAASAVASKVFPAPTPKPPVLSSTVTVAWDLRNGQPNRIVGRISLGTPCGDFVARQGRARYYEVDREAVKFIRQPRSARVVTRCEAA